MDQDDEQIKEASQNTDETRSKQIMKRGGADLEHLDGGRGRDGLNEADPEAAHKRGGAERGRGEAS
eukprot:3714577-Rhodomonas_salina.4